MPIITPKRLRESYQIYENKPCIDEDSLKCTGRWVGGWERRRRALTQWVGGWVG